MRNTPPSETLFIRDVHLECSNLRRRHTPTSCGHDEQVVDALDNEIRSTEADNHPPPSIPPITLDPAPEWLTLRRKFVSVMHGCDAWVFSTPDDGLRGTVGGYPSPALQIPSTRPRLMSRGPPFHQRHAHRLHTHNTRVVDTPRNVNVMRRKRRHGNTFLPPLLRSSPCDS
jgi:hypothetical protein